MVVRSYLYSRRKREALPSSWYFSCNMPRSRPPAAPRESNHKHLLCFGFRDVHLVANCFHSSKEAESLREGTTSLRPATFSVYASSHSFRLFAPACENKGTARYFSRDATLDTGGWLDLTRPGLAPGKKHQAALGASGSGTIESFTRFTMTDY